jgi:hypothetical protein
MRVYDSFFTPRRHDFHERTGSVCRRRGALRARRGAGKGAEPPLQLIFTEKWRERSLLRSNSDEHVGRVGSSPSPVVCNVPLEFVNLVYFGTPLVCGDRIMTESSFWVTNFGTLPAEGLRTRGGELTLLPQSGLTSRHGTLEAR